MTSAPTIVTRIRRFRGLVGEPDGSIVGVRRTGLLRFRPPFTENDKEHIGSFPLSLRFLLSFFRPIERALRHFSFSMIRTTKGSFLSSGPVGISAMKSSQDSFRRAFTSFRGRRPLTVCENASGSLYFGEYFSNKERGPVRVFRSIDDGLSWQVVYTFPAGSIRHVHGIQYDPFRDRLWIFTGDEDGESWIGKSDSGFQDLKCVVCRGQQSRVVSAIVEEDAVFFGTDAPNEQNYIYRMDPAGKKLSKLAEVQHSVFFSGVGSGKKYMSTVVEPSSFNKTDRVFVWYADERNVWQVAFSFQRDRFPTPWFPYPSVYIAKGADTFPYAFLSGCGLRGFDGDCLVVE